MITSRLRRGWASLLVDVAAIVIVTVNCGMSADDVESRKSEMVSAAWNEILSITVEELAAALEGDGQVQLLDIRTKAEYDQGHIRGAKWCPRGKLEFLAAKGKLPATDSRIVVYCKEDGRAALAAKTLGELGYIDVANLVDGFKGWVEQGYSIYNMHGELTVKNFERAEFEE